tara:strand:+ start:271 stop:648 length:378 start_codon:yes stop_codon:yes gene_type:complete
MFFLYTSCEKKKQNIVSENTVKSSLLTESVISESYTPKTPCICNDDGTTILNEILVKRQQFKSIEELYDNKDANNYIKLLQKNWDTIRWKCLKTFGTTMFTPSNCNDPDNIQAIKEKLLKLDIMT